MNIKEKKKKSDLTDVSWKLAHDTIIMDIMEYINFVK